MAAKTILILTANPSDTSRLRLDEEVREIQEGLNLSAERDSFNVVSQWATRPDDLRRAMLKYQPEIVHFSGHGAGAKGLLLESDIGEAKPVSGLALSRLFGLFPNVKCVLFNACYSQVQAEAVVKHVDYVVGMTDAIGDRAAIEFAVGFYDALGYGHPVPFAYKVGLSAIALEGIDEVSTPVLKVRKELAETSNERPAAPEPTVSAPIKEPAPSAPPAPKSPPAGSRAVAQPSVMLEEPEGLVPLDSPFYVERHPIEADCYETVVRPGSLIRIKAPRQLGKTSLLVRTLAHAQSQGFETVRLSFQTSDNATLDNLDEFLQWFCCSVTEELDLEDRLADYWKGARGIVRRCQRYFEKYLLKELDQPIVLGLDEVDQVFEHPEIATDFFGMLRVWHEEGKTNPLWRKLNLVIVHSKEVYVPLSINRSPFNVGLPIELRELNTEEIETLITRHQLDFGAHQKQQLIDLVGGHPYLMRAALYQLARGRISLTQLMEQAPTEGGLYSDHLRRHLLNLEADPDLLGAFKQVIPSYQPVQIGSTEAFKLHSMGLVKYDGNAVVPLCGLYRQYFQSRL
ncbi:AAA-like domain-containing protein [Leptothoe kymatousa]|uniref:AAA-like domain-containing protein n=1 Tax=Leptothoe kymatousa TAU-MAC 1615 TaxID=2364775 RepID=A0ABS5Y3N5_9CYAN|nr:AAA-like domain-containing protein [Leptothoe kymatousa]MBT9311590.1 AAA-like domain-containing protein [Leptothoe kymatousa TAU-MAC 1615]